MFPAVGSVHSYRRPGKMRSSSGTRGEKTTSDQIGPLGRKRTKATNAAPAATSAPKRKRAIRAFGVVLGSLIMKKVKRRSEPDSNWWSGTLQGCPSHSARPKRIAAKVPMKA